MSFFGCVILLRCPLLPSVNDKKMENESEIEQSWKSTKLKLENQLAMLLENDLLRGQNKRDEIINKVHAKVGGSREEVGQFINNLQILN